MDAPYLQLDNWLIELATGEVRPYQSSLSECLRQPSGARLEPRATQLIILLASSPCQVFGKEQIIEALWPGQIVTDDALTRCVSRTRRALNDDPKSPTIIETIPKRGYRLIAKQAVFLMSDGQRFSDLANKAKAPIEKLINEEINTARLPWFAHLRKLIRMAFILLAVLIGAALISQWLYEAEVSKTLTTEQKMIRQADNYYHQIQREDNLMAYELYQQALAIRPNESSALAGLANSIVQMVIRWPVDDQGPTSGSASLGAALESGITRSAYAQRELKRALELAERAVEADPENPKAYKALGFVLSAQSQFDLALSSYSKAIALDDSAWDSMLNSGDILEISGDLAKAITYYEDAFEVMSRVYDERSSQIQPWYADFGALIGDKHDRQGDSVKAEHWYRHVLSFAPYNEAATIGLAKVLRGRGQSRAANSLCDDYQSMIGSDVCSE